MGNPQSVTSFACYFWSWYQDVSLYTSEPGFETSERLFSQQIPVPTGLEVPAWFSVWWVGKSTTQWRSAITRRHSAAMLRSSLTMQQRRTVERFKFQQAGQNS